MMILQSSITVCIPTCDRPHLLREAIESCLQQTRLPTAIVIGDDSKTDETQRMVAALSLKLEIPLDYKRNSPRLGQNANINSLYDRATSSHIILLHDDDLLLPNAIEDLAACWNSYPNLTDAFGKQYVMSHEGDIDLVASEGINRAYFRTTERAGLQLHSYETGLLQQFPNDGFMVTASAARSIRLRSSEEVGAGGDFDFGLRISLAYREFFFIDKYTAVYRKTKTGSVSSSSDDDAALNAYLMLESIRLPEGARELRINKMTELAPRALMQAIIAQKKHQALQIYMSPYHGWRARLSAGGIRRLSLLLLLSLKESIARTHSQ